MRSRWPTSAARMRTPETGSGTPENRSAARRHATGETAREADTTWTTLPAGTPEAAPAAARGNGGVEEQGQEAGTLRTSARVGQDVHCGYRFSLRMRSDGVMTSVRRMPTCLHDHHLALRNQTPVDQDLHRLTRHAVELDHRPLSQLQQVLIAILVRPSCTSS